MFKSVVVAALAVLVSACTVPRPSEVPQAQPKAYARIISMAPSTTETLFALGLGGKIVGVTRYCDFPPEALTKARVGGFLDPNYEAILALEPDLVVLLPVHGDVVIRIADLGIATFTVDHRTFDGILDSFDALGELCGISDRAAQLRGDLETRLDRVRDVVGNADRPTVLLSSARSYGSGRIEDVHVAGKNQWYDDVIRIAGGENAFTDTGIQFPSLSGEALLRLDPDVIVELAPDLEKQGVDAQSIIAEWKSLPSMKAVRDGRIYVLDGDYVSIPGPRFVRLVEDLARILHPELDFEA